MADPYYNNTHAPMPGKAGKTRREMEANKETEPIYSGKSTLKRLGIVCTLLLGYAAVYNGVEKLVESRNLKRTEAGQLEQKSLATQTSQTPEFYIGLRRVQLRPQSLENTNCNVEAQE